MRHVLASSLLLLGGCATEPVPKATTIEPDEFRVELPKPEPVTMREIEWRVIRTDEGVWFAITPNDYEDLALNMNEILRWMREVRASWEVNDE